VLRVQQIISISGVVAIITIVALLVMYALAPLVNTILIVVGIMISSIIPLLAWGFKTKETEQFFHTKSIVKLNNTSIFGDKDPRLAHLTIHFSSKTDTPDTPNPAFGRYVVNNRKMLARWVSTLLEPHIKNHRMSWHAHESREKTLERFSENNYDVKEQDATPEELEIPTDFE